MRGSFGSFANAVKVAAANGKTVVHRVYLGRSYRSSEERRSLMCCNGGLFCQVVAETREKHPEEPFWVLQRFVAEYLKERGLIDDELQETEYSRRLKVMQKLRAAGIAFE